MALTDKQLRQAQFNIRKKQGFSHMPVHVRIPLDEAMKKIQNSQKNKAK